MRAPGPCVSGLQPVALSVTFARGCLAALQPKPREMTLLFLLISLCLIWANLVGLGLLGNYVARDYAVSRIGSVLGQPCDAALRNQRLSQRLTSRVMLRWVMSPLTASVASATALDRQ